MRTDFLNALKLIGFLTLIHLSACMSNVGEVVNSDAMQASITSDRQAELIDLVLEWIETRDDRLVEQIQDEDELDFVQILLESEQMDVDGNVVVKLTPSLNSCSGYWGAYRFAGKAENSWVSSSYSYYWSPNYYMTAPGDDCGTDHDDNMVSFWMGPDYSMTEAAYKVDSDSWSTYWNLLYHNGPSYRVYTSGSYGNAYVCLSNTLDPNTLRFGRDY